MFHNEYFKEACNTPNPSKGLLEQIKSCITKENINKKNDIGETALHLAARKSSSVELIKLLIENGAQVNSPDTFGTTPLHEAVSTTSPSIPLIKLLIENGANVNAKDMEGNSALHCAVAVNPTAIPLFQLLIEKGIEVNAKTYNGDTALHRTIYWIPFLKDEKYLLNPLIKLLMEKGADVNIKNNNNNTVLHVMARIDFCIEAITQLIVNSKNLSALEEILKSNDKRFLDIQKNLTIKSLYALHSLKIPSYIFNVEEFEELFKNIFLKEENVTEIVFNQLINFVQDENVKLLLKRKKDATFNNNSLINDEYFQKACETLNPSKELLEKVKSSITEENITEKNNYGSTPLHLAAVYRSIPLVNLLIENGANVNITNQSSATALHVAANQLDPSVKLCKLLIENGVDVNKQNYCGQTALHHVINYSIEISKLLIEKGADVNIKDRDGKSTLNTVIMNKNDWIDCINLLIENGADLYEFKIIYESLKSSHSRENLFFKSLYDLYSFKIQFPVIGPNEAFDKLLKNISPKTGNMTKKFFNQLINFVQDDNVKALLVDKRDTIYPHTFSDDFKRAVKNNLISQFGLFNQVTISDKQFSLPDFGRCKYAGLCEP